MRSRNYFQVADIIKELSKELQIYSLYKIENKIFKVRCFFIGRVNEIDLTNDQERILNTLISPVELSEGEFQSPLGCSNFIDFEVFHNQEKPLEVKNGTN